MAWLVTGGAGYIGSHVVRAFVEDGIEPVVLDDLSSGHRNFVAEAVAFHEGSILDRDLLDSVFGSHTITGVVTWRGSVRRGLGEPTPHTYSQNVTGMIMLLETMAAHAVDKVVFSSSAAVFGTPDTSVVTEESPTRPESPYGESKLIGEWLLRDQARATASTANPLRHTSLRYFNVVGSGFPDLYDTSPHNLFPLVLEALPPARRRTSTAIRFRHPTGPASVTMCSLGPAASPCAPPKRSKKDERWSRYTTSAAGRASPFERSWTPARVTGIAFTPELRPPRPGIRLGSSPAAIVPLGT